MDDRTNRRFRDKQDLRQGGPFAGLVNEAVAAQKLLHEVVHDVLSRVVGIGREAVQLLLDKLGHGNVG